MKYKSKLHEWLRNATPSEQLLIANKASVKVHYLQRLARCEIPDPGLYSVRRIIKAVNEYSMLTPDNRLPEITLDDI